MWNLLYLAFVQVPIFVHKQPKNARAAHTKIGYQLVGKCDRNLPLHSVAFCSQPLIFHRAVIQFDTQKYSHCSQTTKSKKS